MQRSSDAHPVHPAHGTYHLLRLLVGSVIGGWTAMMAFMILGFLGSIEFIDSFSSAARWTLLGGSLLGIIVGIPLALVAGLLHNVIPALRRSVHPLALVRAGFVFLVLWPLLALIAWPSWSLGFWLGPPVALIAAWAAVRSNPHAELLPRTSLGRTLGTAIGPLLLLAFVLAIVIPMFNRALGTPHAPRLLFIAVDSMDGPLLARLLRSEEADRLPELSALKEEGVYGSLSASQPLIPARLWADLMTGTEWETHGILDRNSTADDLEGVPLWEILAMRDLKVGLFQMLPTRSAGVSPAVLRALGEVRTAGRDPGLPSAWRSAYLACRLARLGVELETISTLTNECIWEWATRPAPRMVYARRKGLQFLLEADLAISLLRSHRVGAAFLRFPSLGSLFLEYWRYSNPEDFGPPPEDVDAALAAGLGRVLPDAYGRLDDFIGRLEPFRKDRTLICIAANHGVRSANYTEREWPRLSAEHLLEVTGWEGRVLTDYSATGVCLRAPGRPDDQDTLVELETLLRSAERCSAADPNAPLFSQCSLFTVTRHPDCIEVSLLSSPGQTPDTPVTVGDWSGNLAYLLETGEPQSAVIDDSGLFMIVGPHIRPGASLGTRSLLDIAPTILHALGIELAENLAGRPMQNLFDAEWYDEHPPVNVDTYAPEPTPPPPTEPFQ